MKNILLIAGFLWMLTACSANKNERGQPAPVTNENAVALTDAQMKNAAIETAQMTKQNISATLRVNGKIDVPPQNIISVSAPLGGYLVSTKLLPGMHINRGEQIATMQDQQFIQLQQDYLLAKSSLHFAELEYNRQKELNQSQASSDKVTQQAQAEMNKQHIMMNALAEKLKLININPNKLTTENISKTVRIYSTINGFVSKVNINLGKYVTPSDVMFELIDPDDIHLNLNVFEKDLDKLFIGQNLLAYSNAQPDKKYQCDIMLISKDINNNGGTEVHCHFENYHKSLIPGMYMNAEIQVSSKASATLPEESIVHFEGKDFVFIQTGKQNFEMHEVKKGNAEKGFVEILNAAEMPDQTFVTKGAYTLLMKLKNNEEEE